MPIGDDNVDAKHPGGKDGAHIHSEINLLVTTMRSDGVHKKMVDGLEGLEGLVSLLESSPGFSDSLDILRKIMADSDIPNDEILPTVKELSVGLIKKGRSNEERRR